MRRAGLRLLGAVLLVLPALPSPAAAQARRCNQVLPADAQRIVNAQGEINYFRDPVRVVCTGGLVLEADSAVIARGAGYIHLVGNVLYRDSTRELTADWANYVGGPDVLYARGNVLLRDLANESRITGQELEYQRETPARPQALTIVRGGRPYALLPPSARGGDPAAADTAAAVEVWADRFRFEGEELFIGQGNAEFRRGQLRGAADTARFEQLSEQIQLIGDARVEEEQYRLEGARINAFLPGDTLREVRALGEARLRSDDLNVASDQIRIALAGGQLERLEAWNPEALAAHRPPATAEPADEGASPDADTAQAAEPAEGAALDRAPADRPVPVPAVADSASLPRAMAVAQDFTLRADSIEARADSGSIREIRAISRAFGERDADSLATRLPTVVARDWIQGDTIIGYFVEAEPGADADPELDAPDVAPVVEADPPVETGDTAEVVLERIVVVGGTAPALSLYRLEPESEGGEGAINFMRAQRIILHLIAGELDRVDAEGPIQGLYLDPTQQGGAATEPPPAQETEGPGA